MNTQSLKVLLVEDDRSLARLYQTKFELCGYAIDVVYDGEECLTKLATYQPDIILLDVILPKIDGFEVLKRIKEMPNLKNTPIILLTNLGQDEDIEKGKQLGAVNYLVKSQFTPSEIVKKLEQTMQGMVGGGTQN